MRVKIWGFILLAAAALFTFNACNDDEAGPAEVVFQFDYQVDGQAFNPNTIYTVNGTAVRFDVANFYVGGITFVPAGGLEVVFPDQYLLVTPDNTRQPVGTTDPAGFDELSFFIGVDPVTNNQTTTDFTSRPAGDPLAEQVPQMHWSWTSGYRFLRIDGEVDTDGDGTPDKALEFHLGRDQYLTTLAFSLQRELRSGANEIVFTFDLAKLFEGIDLATNFSMHTAPDEAGTAITFTNNFEKAFTLQ